MNSVDSGDINRNSGDRLPDEVKAGADKEVALEICEAEGLPSGWTKELEVKKRGSKIIRTDAYYIDPVSGCKFRSMKDARHYIETGEIGKLAIRPKDNSSNILGSKDDEACLPVKKQKLEVGSSNQSSKPSKAANDEQVDSMAGTEEVAKDKLVLSPAGPGHLTPINMLISGEKGSGSIEPSALENESSKKKGESKVGKHKEKKNLNLPRRSSKRLSGVPLDPTPELKTTRRPRRPAVKNSTEKASETKKPESENISPSGDQLAKESETKLENATITEVALKTQPDENSGFCLDMPIGELCQDPCIAFAVKTLTGISFDNPDTVQVSTGSNSDFGGSLATSEDQTRKDAITGVHMAQPDQALNNVATESKLEELGMPGGPIDLSFADMWDDPCIGFAIKTLTGDIPLECDAFFQDGSQNKGSSVQSQGSSGLSLEKNAGNCQSGVSGSQAPKEPGLPSGTIGDGREEQKK